VPEVKTAVTADPSKIAYIGFPVAEDGRQITFSFITPEYDEMLTPYEKNAQPLPKGDGRVGDARGLVSELLGKRILQSIHAQYLVRRGSEDLILATWEPEDRLKRSSEEVRKMIKDFEEDNICDLARCAVCNEGTSLDTNAIMLCDKCDLPVHQQCYGVTEIPEGDWFCDTCKAGLKNEEVSCVLCPFKGGAFKPCELPKNKWAHVRCSLWMPEVYFKNSVTMNPVSGCETVCKDRFNLSCYLCKKKGGASIQCKNGHCYEAFHPYCAVEHGLCLDSCEEKGQIVSKTYCHRHDPERNVAFFVENNLLPAHVIESDEAEKEKKMLQKESKAQRVERIATERQEKKERKRYENEVDASPEFVVSDVEESEDEDGGYGHRYSDDGRPKRQGRPAGKSRAGREGKGPKRGEASKGPRGRWGKDTTECPTEIVLSLEERITDRKVTKAPTCHRCKYPKPDLGFASCAYGLSHHFCEKCLQTSFGFELEDLLADPSLWTCPVCNNDCPCAGCERRRVKHGGASVARPVASSPIVVGRRSVSRRSKSKGEELVLNLPCGVCCSPFSFEGNEIVVCNTCGTGAHQRCLGLSGELKLDYQCQSCETSGGVYPPSCALCPITEGPMIQEDGGSGRWAHVVCAVWNPTVNLASSASLTCQPCASDAADSSAFKLTGLNEAISGTSCVACGVSYGSTITCGAAGCEHALHPLCARKLSLHMEQGSTKDGGSYTTLLCPEHTEAKKAAIKFEQKPLAASINTGILRFMFERHADPLVLSKTADLQRKLLERLLESQQLPEANPDLPAIWLETDAYAKPVAHTIKQLMCMNDEGGLATVARAAACIASLQKAKTKDKPSLMLPNSLGTASMSLGRDRGVSPRVMSPPIALAACTIGGKATLPKDRNTESVDIKARSGTRRSVAAIVDDDRTCGIWELECTLEDSNRLVKKGSHLEEEEEEEAHVSGDALIGEKEASPDVNMDLTLEGGDLPSVSVIGSVSIMLQDTQLQEPHHDPELPSLDLTATWRLCPTTLQEEVSTGSSNPSFEEAQLEHLEELLEKTVAINQERLAGLKILAEKESLGESCPTQCLTALSETEQNENKELESSYMEMLVARSKERLATEVLDTDQNGELCEYCNDGGDLLCCDACPAAVHLHCVELDAFPEGDWYCQKCEMQRERDSRIVALGEASVDEPTQPRKEAKKESKEQRQLAALLKMKRSSAWDTQFSSEMQAILVPPPPKAEKIATERSERLYTKAEVVKPEKKLTYLEPEGGVHSVMGVDDIPSIRREHACDLCDQKGGIVVQCGHGKCLATVHPICARREALDWSVVKHGVGEKTTFMAMCPKHSEPFAAETLVISTTNNQIQKGSNNVNKLCDVCAVSRKGMRFQTCIDCNITVHKNCYRAGRTQCGGGKHQDGVWRCESCTAKVDAPIECVICCSTDQHLVLELKKDDPAAPPKWAHAFCVAWCPEVSSSNPDSKDPEETETEDEQEDAKPPAKKAVVNEVSVPNEVSDKVSHVRPLVMKPEEPLESIHIATSLPKAHVPKPKEPKVDEQLAMESPVESKLQGKVESAAKVVLQPMAKSTDNKNKPVQSRLLKQLMDHGTAGKSDSAGITTSPGGTNIMVPMMSKRRRSMDGGEGGGAEGGAGGGGGGGETDKTVPTRSGGDLKRKMEEKEKTSNRNVKVKAETKEEVKKEVKKVAKTDDSGVVNDVKDATSPKDSKNGKKDVKKDVIKDVKKDAKKDAKKDMKKGENNIVDDGKDATPAKETKKRKLSGPASARREGKAKDSEKNLMDEITDVTVLIPFDNFKGIKASPNRASPKTRGNGKTK